MRDRLHSFVADRQGATGIVVGLVFATLLGSAAITADLSVYYVQKRKLQSATDAAALFAVSSPSRPPAKAAGDVYSLYSLSPSSLTLTPGTYDNTLPLGSRFRSGAGGNALSVAATLEAPMFFGRIFQRAGSGKTTVTIGANAKAAALPLAAYAIGSRTAAISGGIANLVLGAALGSGVGLSALDYQALANSKIDLVSTLSLLNTRLGSPKATYADLLGTSIPVSTVLSSMASAVGPSSSSVLQTLANAAGGTGSLKLGSLLDLGPAATLPVGTPLPVQITTSSYDLVTALSRTLMSGKTFNIDLSATIPGVAFASAVLSIVQTSPSYVVAPWGRTTIAMTQQAQLSVKVGANVAGLGSVQLPISLNVAKATALTQGPTCTAGTPQLALAVVPTMPNVTLGSDGTNVVPVASLFGQSIYVTASASVQNVTPQTQLFTPPDVAAGTIKTTSLETPVSSLINTAIGQTRISLGSPNGLSISLPLLSPALVSLASPADSAIEGILQAAGLKIGSADTWATDLRCGTPQLIE